MAEDSYLERLDAAAAFLREKAPDFRPDVCFILGSGMTKAVPPLEGALTIPYVDIPGFPRATVPGHEGRLVLGRASGKDVVVMQGRFHYYEGHDMESIALPLRAFKALGLKSVVVTAAVGSMRARIKPGHFMVVADHINLMGCNPLRAFHQEGFGTMFSDMSSAYDPRLRKLLLAACAARKVAAREGVYVAVGGPSYETPAEIRAFRALGGDVVGMSVVPEVAVARQMGVTAAALAWISNMAAGMRGAILSHEAVLALGERVAREMGGILSDVARSI